jgi:hypothetical protein
MKNANKITFIDDWCRCDCGNEPHLEGFTLPLCSQCDRKWKGTQGRLSLKVENPFTGVL